MVKVGDTVVIDGDKLTVKAIWAAGKHNRFQLSDGREIMALDIAIAEGRVALEETKATSVTGWGKTISDVVDDIVDDEEDED
jgi:hypothetical protein